MYIFPEWHQAKHGNNTQCKCYLRKIFPSRSPHSASKEEMMAKSHDIPTLIFLPSHNNVWKSPKNSHFISLRNVNETFLVICKHCTKVDFFSWLQWFCNSGSITTEELKKWNCNRGKTSVKVTSNLLQDWWSGRREDNIMKNTYFLLLKFSNFGLG